MFLRFFIVFINTFTPPIFSRASPGRRQSTPAARATRLTCTTSSTASSREESEEREVQQEDHLTPTWQPTGAFSPRLRLTSRLLQGQQGEEGCLPSPRRRVTQASTCRGLTTTTGGPTLLRRGPTGRGSLPAEGRRSANPSRGEARAGGMVGGREGDGTTDGRV